MYYYFLLFFYSFLFQVIWSFSLGFLVFIFWCSLQNFQNCSMWSQSKAVVLFLSPFFKSDCKVNSTSNLYSKVPILWHTESFCKECALAPGQEPDPLTQLWSAPQTERKQETHSNSPRLWSLSGDLASTHSSSISGTTLCTVLEVLWLLWYFFS